MMNLVIENIKQDIVHASRILPKRDYRFLKTLGWNLRPKLIDLLGAFVPELQNVFLWTRVATRQWIPVPSDDSSGRGFCHTEQLQRHCPERAHRTDREAEQLIVREGGDHAPGQSAMSLPMLQQSCRWNHKSRVNVCVGHKHLINESRFTVGAFGKRVTSVREHI